MIKWRLESIANIKSILKMKTIVEKSLETNWKEEKCSLLSIFNPTLEHY